MATRGKEHVTPTASTGSPATSKDFAARGKPEIPHMGWNTLDMVREHPVLERCRWAEGPHAYFVHSYISTRQTRPMCWRGRITAPGDGDRRQGHVIGTQFHPRRAAFRAGLISNFLKWKRDSFSRHRPEERPMRAPRAGRHGGATCSTSIRRRRRRLCRPGVRISACGRSRWRLCRQAMNAQAVESMLKSVTCRCSSAAASAISPPSKPGSPRAWRGSSSAPRSARPELVKARQRNSRPRAVGLDAATARSRSRAGRDLGSISASDCAALRGCRRCRDHLHRHARDGLLKGLNLDHHCAGRAHLDSSHRLGGLPRSTMSKRCWSRGRKLAGAIAAVRFTMDG